jgi:hypothetical protein
MTKCILLNTPSLRSDESAFFNFIDRVSNEEYFFLDVYFLSEAENILVAFLATI